jgi:hypothetical protein
LSKIAANAKLLSSGVVVDTKGMYCPYCNVDHDQHVKFSKEHIVPFAVGGSNCLTILVCEDSNNRLGGDVDKPFIEFWSVRADRFLFELAGTDGTLPTLDLSGTSQIDGREVRVIYRITKEGKDLRIGSPMVTKAQTATGEQWTVSGSPDAVRRVITGKLESQLKKELEMRDSNGVVLTMDGIDGVIDSAEERLLLPEIVWTERFVFLEQIRFFAKLALATCHFVLGESFSKSIQASRLRQAMEANTLADVVLPGAAIWPDLAGTEQLLAMFQEPDKHVLTVIQETPRVFIASLFGKYCAVIPLDLDTEEVLPEATDEERVLEISLPSRYFEDQSFRGYLEKLVSVDKIPASIDPRTLRQ